MYKITLTHNNFLYAFWGSLMSFFTDINTAIMGIMICVIVDTITGFWAAPYRGKKRNSHSLSRFVTKIITYLTAVILMHVLEMLVFPDYAVIMKIQLARLACTAFCGLEIYSTMENLYDITGLEAFKYITQLSVKKIKDATGVELKGKENDKEN